MRDERGSDRERRDERRKNDCGYPHTRSCCPAYRVFSSLISRSRYLSSLIAVLKPLTAALLLAVPSLASAQRAADYGPLYGVRFGSAQHQSVYGGIARVTHITPDEQTGTTLELEIGRSAGQVGLGVIGVAPMAAEVRIQLVGLRTWGRATEIAPGQDYVGVEAQIGVILGASVGYYRRVHGNAPGDATFRGIRFVIGV